MVGEGGRRDFLRSAVPRRKVLDLHRPAGFVQSNTSWWMVNRARVAVCRRLPYGLRRRRSSVRVRRDVVRVREGAVGPRDVGWRDRFRQGTIFNLRQAECFVSGAADEAEAIAPPVGERQPKWAIRHPGDADRLDNLDVLTAGRVRGFDPEHGLFLYKRNVCPFLLYKSFFCKCCKSAPYFNWLSLYFSEKFFFRDTFLRY